MPKLTLPPLAPPGDVAALAGVADPDLTTVDAQKVIYIADLVDSTAFRVERGHTLGYLRGALHNGLHRAAVLREGGEVLKEMGDAVLAAFDDPVAALRAGLAVRGYLAALPDSAALGRTVKTKIGVTAGIVHRIRGASSDFIGDAVDRCARVCSQARPNQLLVDGVVYGMARTKLRDFEDVLVGLERRVDLKGIGPTDLREVSLKDIGFASNHTVDVHGQPVPISTVKDDVFPPGTETGARLACESCGAPIDKPAEAVVGLEERAGVIERIVIIHRTAACAAGRDAQWRNLSDLLNPVGFVRFLSALAGEWHAGKSLKDPRGLTDLYVGCYRHVFRKSTAEELATVDNAWV